MSKIANRTAVKSLTNLTTDCQYLSQIGLQLFNDNGQNPDTFNELVSNFKTIHQDLVVALDDVRSLIPSN